MISGYWLSLPSLTSHKVSPGLVCPVSIEMGWSPSWRLEDKDGGKPQRKHSWRHQADPWIREANEIWQKNWGFILCLSDHCWFPRYKKEAGLTGGRSTELMFWGRKKKKTIHKAHCRGPKLISGSLRKTECHPWKRQRMEKHVTERVPFMHQCPLTAGLKHWSLTNEWWGL